MQNTDLPGNLGAEVFLLAELMQTVPTRKAKAETKNAKVIKSLVLEV